LVNFMLFDVGTIQKGGKRKSKLFALIPWVGRKKKELRFRILEGRGRGMAGFFSE